MFNLEDGKRKLPNNNNLKNVVGCTSHNNLMSTLDKKRTDVSKDKYEFACAELEIISCRNAATTSILKEALSSTLDRSKIIRIVRTIKLRPNPIRNFFNPN